MTPALWLILGIVAFFALAWLMDVIDNPAPRCRHCDRKLGKDHIPPDIREAARAAGLSLEPMWYVGRLYCPYYKRQKTLDDIVRESREKANAA